MTWTSENRTPLNTELFARSGRVRYSEVSLYSQISISWICGTIFTSSNESTDTVREGPADKLSVKGNTNEVNNTCCKPFTSWLQIFWPQDPSKTEDSPCLYCINPTRVKTVKNQKIYHNFWMADTIWPKYYSCLPHMMQIPYAKYKLKMWRIVWVIASH